MENSGNESLNASKILRPPYRNSHEECMMEKGYKESDIPSDSESNNVKRECCIEYPVIHLV